MPSPHPGRINIVHEKDKNVSEGYYRYLPVVCDTTQYDKLRKSIPNLSSTLARYTLGAEASTRAEQSYPSEDAPRQAAWIHSGVSPPNIPITCVGSIPPKMLDIWP